MPRRQKNIRFVKTDKPVAPVKESIFPIDN